MVNQQVTYSLPMNVETPTEQILRMIYGTAPPEVVGTEPQPRIKISPPKELITNIVGNAGASVLLSNYTQQQNREANRLSALSKARTKRRDNVTAK